MNKIFATIALLTSVVSSWANEYPTPESLKAFYLKAYPQTETIETVATATADGSSYYIIWGYSKAGEDGPDDTEGAFKITPNGEISQIDNGLPAALPFYYIEDAKIWEPLVKSFIQFEVSQAGGKDKFQASLLERPFIAQQLAQAYQSEGFKISPSTKILKNIKGEIAQ